MSSTLEDQDYAISYSRRIAAPHEKVWEVIAGSGALATCHPFVRSQSPLKGRGVGATDTITYNSGLTLSRKFVHWYEGLGFDLDLIWESGDAAYVAWRTSPDGEAGSLLTVVLTPPHVRDAMCEEARAFIHGLRLKPMVELYLASMLKGIQHFLETGEQVRRNQFGAHPWFSP
jgi:hypothetical protein